MSSRYSKRRAKGLCGSCGKNQPINPACSECRKRMSLRRLNFIDQGLCPKCGSELETGFKECKKCRNKAQNKKMQNKKDGKCSHCQHDISPGHTMCESCLNKLRQHRRNHLWEIYAKTYLGDSKRHQELRDIYDKQNGKCAYSGLPITIGVNASLDHIVPKGKGGSDDITNLQWIMKCVNHMKWDMEETEFLSMCITIAANRPIVP